jgi:transglutaminase-like putative cysteine protease
MIYRISHITTYEYSEPVSIGHNIVHLTPRSCPRQTCLRHRLAVRPRPHIGAERDDGFGNRCRYFAIQQAHRKLLIGALNRIEILPRDPLDLNSSASWESLRDQVEDDYSPEGIALQQLVYESPEIASTEEIAEYARASFRPGRNALEAALELMERVHAEFTYDTKATEVHTTAAEAFRLRRGVCQDFANVLIAALRSQGLPARYVSGYLRTNPPPGRPRLVGADATHAWVSLFCGPAGWVDLDPTNNVVPSEDHITLAWGRDYSDVAPIKGIVLGGGHHTMQVAVDVVPWDERYDASTAEEG